MEGCQPLSQEWLRQVLVCGFWLAGTSATASATATATAAAFALAVRNRLVNAATPTEEPTWERWEIGQEVGVGWVGG